MEDFIVFDDVYGKKNAVRKSVIISVYEDEDTDDVVCVSTNDENFETNESFDSIISKLAKQQEINAMSKFIVIKTEYGQMMAIRKDRVTEVTENCDKDVPTKIWVEDESYDCVNDFNEIIKELEK